MMERLAVVRTFALLFGLASVAACGSGSDPAGPGPGPGTLPELRDAATERMVTPPPAREGGVEAGAGGAESGVAAFGLTARAAKQTCIAPVTYRTPAATLSATGCVDPSDVKKPAASLIPYDVISPLWSDGADKQRFLALPDGTTIHVKDCQREPASCAGKADGGTTDDEGHWQLPVGTVLVKSYLFAGKFLETRLFVRFADRWTGYSYQWDDAQTEATLVSTDGETKAIVNAAGQPQTWSFPSRGGCLECHNDPVGGSLGLETIQLDRDLTYPSGVKANQIATLEHIGAFDAPVRRLRPLVDPRATARTVDERARSYLHANCGNCHRPDGPFNGLDLRIGVPLADMKMCNTAPQKGEQGVVGAKLLVPQTPDKSITLLRMQAPDKAAGRMPTLASSVLDSEGVALISDWIKGTTACP